MKRSLAAAWRLELALQRPQLAMWLISAVLVAGSGPVTVWGTQAAMRAASPEAQAARDAGAREPLSVHADEAFRGWLRDDDRLKVVNDDEPALARVTVAGSTVWVSRSLEAPQAEKVLPRVRAVAKRRNTEALKAAYPDGPVTDLLAREVVTVERSQAQAAGDLIGRALPGALWFVMLFAALNISVDVFTRRAETGADQALFVTATDRRAIVLAKVMLVLGAAVGFGLLWLTTAALAAHGMGLTAEASIGPGALGAAAVSTVVWGVLVSALTIAAVARCQTFKQATIASAPLALLLMVPTSLAAAPQASLTALTVGVPGLNLALGLRAWLGGELTALAAAAVGVFTALHVAGALGGLAWWFGADPRPSVGLSAEERRAQGDFAPDTLAVVLVAFAVVIVVSASGALVGPAAGLSLSVGSLGVVAVASASFFGAPFRHTFSAYAPTPADALWAVLVGLTLHGVAFVVLGLTTLVVEVAPATQAQLTAVAALPAWAVVLAGAVTPGIAEELLCRGALLGMLRTRYGVGLSVALSSLVFGLLHMDLARVPTTAALGVIFALLTVRTGSIVPAMIAHTVHNALLFLVSGQVGDAPWMMHPAWLTVMVGITTTAVARSGRVRAPAA